MQMVLTEVSHFTAYTSIPRHRQYFSKEYKSQTTMAIHPHPSRFRTQVDTRTKLLNRLGFIQQQPSFPSKPSPPSSPPGSPPRKSPTVDYSSSPEKRTIPSPGTSPSLTFQVSLNDTYRYTATANLSLFHFFDDRRRVSTPQHSRHQTSSSCPHQKNNERKQVRFQETVDVTSIPSRYQYSERIKQCIWTNRMEMQEMTLRNYMELAYENYDWNQVIMENQMYIDTMTGTLIHPCHFDRRTGLLK